MCPGNRCAVAARATYRITPRPNHPIEGVRYRKSIFSNGGTQILLAAYVLSGFISPRRRIVRRQFHRVAARRRSSEVEGRYSSSILAPPPPPPPFPMPYLFSPSPCVPPHLFFIDYLHWTSLCFFQPIQVSVSLHTSLAQSSSSTLQEFQAEWLEMQKMERGVGERKGEVSPTR